MTRMTMRIAGLFAFLSLLMAGQAAAATCTSKASGSWASAATWTCTGTPVLTIPDATATAVIASPHTVTLVGSVSVTNLTINSGGTLVDNGNRTLTISGNLTVNGAISNGGGRIELNMTGNTAVISGTGSLTSVRLYTSGTTPTIAAGSNLTFTGSSRIYAGRTQGGATVAGSVLTINGTINSTVTTASTDFLRLYATNTVIGSTGVINASVSSVTYNTTTSSVTNNGSVSVNRITQNAGTNSWTQGANSSLTVSAVSSVGTFNAHASGNTVTYNGSSTVIAPSAGYWNLAGTIFPGACPVAYTISGSNPCPVGGPVSVTLSPGTCVDDATVGATTWGGLTNVGSSNNAYATTTTAATVGTKLTHYLKCTNYGFAIPASATINGITVGVERNISSTNRTTARDNAVRIVKAGAIGATDRSTATAYTTADVAEAHGGTADLWGVSWTPADINLSTFGAAFSASVTTTRTNSRTVSVDHMPITVTYTAGATAPHHIQIDHDGAGQTCRAETLTVTACANAACTAPHFSAAAVSGNVIWAGTPGGSIPFAIASGGTGQTTVSLPVSTAQTVTLGTSAVSPSPTATSTCVNAGGGTACNVVFSSASACFDAVEVGATATALYTKLSGTAFSLDVTAASAYSGTLQVELVNAASGTCATYTSLSPVNTQSTTFASQTRKTLNFTYAGAARNVKVRITGSGASSCSSGRFAIRPQSMTITSSINADPLGTNVAATPVVKAGASFTLNADTGIAGYDGTPAVDGAKISAHVGAVVSGTVSGTFGAADAAGLATGSSFAYSEVGYFRVDAEGVFDDTFTAVDSAAGDCTNDFSNTKDAAGKYGCKFGNTAASAYFGRFIPDHFGVTQAAFDNRADWCDQGILVSDGTTVCVSPAFTYMGELMNANFTLKAESASNVTTQNYHGAFAKLTPLAADNTLVFGAVDGAVPTSLTARLDTSVVAANGTGSFVNGEANISVPLAITRGAAEDGPFAALNVGIAPVDSDNVATSLDLDTDGDAVSDRTQVNSAVTAVRYGRTKLSNAHGSELLALPMTATAQYWDGADWVVSADDNETSLTLGAAGYQRKTGGAWVVAPPANATVTAGILNYTLNSGGGTGSVDISVAAPTYLPSNTARATFGVYKGNREFIYLRENY